MLILTITWGWLKSLTLLISSYASQMLIFSSWRSYRMQLVFFFFFPTCLMWTTNVYMYIFYLIGITYFFIIILFIIYNSITIYQNTGSLFLFLWELPWLFLYFFLYRIYLINVEVTSLIIIIKYNLAPSQCDHHNF